MEREMNEKQRDYAMAKAKCQALKETMDEMEQEFIREKGVKNPDGSIPRFTWAIADEELSYRLSNELDELPGFRSLWEQKLEADKALKKSEQDLLDYTMSIVPPKVQDLILTAMDSKRQELIDLAFRLDTSTVPRLR